MKILIIVFCAALLGLIAIGLEASHCSPHKKREMIRKVCGNYKRKRGIPSTYEYENKHRFYEENSVSDYDHFNPDTIIANDTSGGILIRHKRNKLRYCCVNSGNCTTHFFC